MAQELARLHGTAAQKEEAFVVSGRRHAWQRSSAMKPLDGDGHDCAKCIAHSEISI